MKVEIKKRKFLGMVGYDKRQTKEDRVINQKALKAYLKGKKVFRHGFETVKRITGNTASVPRWFAVPMQDRKFAEL